MSKKVVAGVIIGAVLLVVVAATIWLFMSNQVRIVWGATTNNGTAVVCGSEVVDKYNAAAFYLKRGSSDALTIDKEGMNNLATDIKNKKGYEADPTCQTILFWTAVSADDYKSAKTAYDAIESLHGKGIFADSNIRNNEDLSTDKQRLDSLSGSGVIREGEGNTSE